MLFCTYIEFTSDGIEHTPKATLLRWAPALGITSIQRNWWIRYIILASFSNANILCRLTAGFNETERGDSSAPRRVLKVAFGALLLQVFTCYQLKLYVFVEFRCLPISSFDICAVFTTPGIVGARIIAVSFPWARRYGLLW